MPTKREQTKTDKRRMRRKFAEMERIAVVVSEGNDSDLALLVTRLSERQLAQSLLPESEKRPTRAENIDATNKEIFLSNIQKQNQQIGSTSGGAPYQVQLVTLHFLTIQFKF